MKIMAKVSTFSAAVLLGLFILNKPANATTECGIGYIQAVMMNYRTFANPNLIGIEVKGYNNDLYYFFTDGWTGVGTGADARLLQLAQSAYLSQARVFVQVDAANCNDTVTLDNKTWFRKWSGLWIQNY